MILVLGEILIDIFDNYQRIGGAPFNFAYHMKQLGWPVRFITRIGDDPQGRQVLQYIRQSGFDTRDVQIDPHHPTGTVRVAVDRTGSPDFDILDNVAYDHIDFDNGLNIPKNSPVQMLYMGTLAQRTQSALARFSNFIENGITTANCFFDINLRPPHVNTDAVRAALEKANLVKLNEGELDALGTQFNTALTDAQLMRWLRKEFSIQWLIVTKGADGSLVVTATETQTQPPTPAPRMVDAVGAGDAYAAVMAAGFLKKIPLSELLPLASRFAAQICSNPGALPEDDAAYAPLGHIIQGDPHGA